LGCGAIGTQIALAIDSGKIPATLTHVYDTKRSQADNLVSKLKLKPEVVANSHLLSSNPVDLVVEAASQDAVRKDAVSILQNKKDLIEIPQNILNDLQIITVKTVDEVLKAALIKELKPIEWIEVESLPKSKSGEKPSTGSTH